MRRSICTVFAVTMLAVSFNAFAGNTSSVGNSQAYSNYQPSLGLTPLVRLEGLFQTIGEVAYFAGNFAPEGWAKAEGQLLPINQYQALFSRLGTMYGGDGESTFALPDLRGRSAVHTGSASMGAGEIDWSQGMQAGSANTQLNINQIPAHTHNMPSQFTSVATTSAGGNPQHPVNNVQPSLGLDFRIATTGIYPSPTILSDNLVFDNESYIATVRMFAGNDQFDTLPGTIPTNGQTLPIAQNTALFSLIGTIYGGDGESTLGIPDLNGRVVIGEGNGPGLPSSILGHKKGVDQYTLATNQTGHAHTVSVPNLQVVGGVDHLPTSTTGSNNPVDQHQPSLTMNYVIALQGIFPSRS